VTFTQKPPLVMPVAGIVLLRCIISSMQPVLSHHSWRVVVIIGDLVVLSLVTLAGFAQHGTLQSSAGRLAITGASLVLAWFLVAPHLGVFDPRRMSDPRQLWRPFWAMVLAGPLAGWLRGALLNTPILPVFVMVLGGVSALSLLAWRTSWWAISRRKIVQHG
jgi:hypothetical protein